MNSGYTPSAYTKRPVSPLAIRANEAFCAANASGATVSDRDRYRAAKPSWTAVVTPRPAQIGPSLKPYGNVVFTRALTVGRTTSKVRPRPEAECRSWRCAQGWPAVSAGKRASSSRGEKLRMDQG